MHLESLYLVPIAKVIVFQAYKNNSSVPIEAKYVFPLDDMAAGVCVCARVCVCACVCVFLHVMYMFSSFCCSVWLRGIHQWQAHRG